MPETPESSWERFQKPTGPRPVPLSSRSSSATQAPKSVSDTLRTTHSTTSLLKAQCSTEPPLDSFASFKGAYAESPDESPSLPDAPGNNRQISEYRPLPPSTFHTLAAQEPRTPPSRSPPQDSRREIAQNRSKTLPESRPVTPTSFVVSSRPSTPNHVAFSRQKNRPQPSRLNTNVDSLNGDSSTVSPSKVSPSYRHWQQVRAHVMAPTPLEERQNARFGKMPGLVSKAAGKFGFRQAAENVIGYTDRRQSMNMLLADLGELTEEEKEAITRERRKFARDVKTCLDACALEESRRRLDRIGYGKHSQSHRQDTKYSIASVHSSVIHPHPHAAQRFIFDPSFSAFAPLLMELHKYLPAARMKKPWARTCPHHSEILAELGIAFLKDNTSTEGERQQALEVFGTIVKNWAADTAEEVLLRWQWLCHALLTDDRQTRNRGFALLESLLRFDSALPTGHEYPHTSLSFHSLASDLLLLLHSVETSQNYQQAHVAIVRGLLADLKEGRVMRVDETSLVDLVGELKTEESIDGIEDELVWMAVGSVLKTHPPLSRWLLLGKQPAFREFMPPLLHTTPNHTPSLRIHATIIFIESLIILMRKAVDFSIIPYVWRVIKEVIIPVVECFPSHDTLLTASGMAMFEMEIHLHRMCLEDRNLDPENMNTYTAIEGTQVEHRIWIAKHSAPGDTWQDYCFQAAKQVIKDAHLPARLKQSEPLLFAAQPLLNCLSTTYPQILYKPLFTLSASTQTKSLSSSLHLVHILSSLIGSTRFWITSPQMVTIVLMGDAPLRPNKMKVKEEPKLIHKVRLGRWAVAVELILAIEAGTKEEGKKWRSFGEALESRLATLIDAEINVLAEDHETLPDEYKALICRLLLCLRMKTLSVKKPPWLELLLSWFVNMPLEKSHKEESDIVKSLCTVYTDLFLQLTSNKHSSNSATNPFSTFTSQNHIQFTSDSRLSILTQSFEDVATSLLVVVHSCLAIDNWERLVPFLWRWYGTRTSARKEVGFLLEKCAEMVPTSLRLVIISDLKNSNPSTRSQVMRNLSTLFAWRYQILCQPILTPRRGPVFHFPGRTLDFVATDIGSSHWISSQDVQDAQLQRFGQTLPLELRQRLFELGWSDDDGLKSRLDWEQMPVSALSNLVVQQDGTLLEGTIRPSSPLSSPSRKSSNASGSSYIVKRRKAIFAPVLIDIIYEQMMILAKEVDGPTNKLSFELVRLLQRDDSTAFLKPLTEKMSDSFLEGTERINAVSGFLNPNYAYSALNAVVGCLKTTLRANPDGFTYWEAALTTIVRLIPYVSEFSLRDIRKSKVERVLLPASIHEEEGALKLYGPWQVMEVAGQRVVPKMTVQAAQLLILKESLVANPKEVYLVKKMVATLPTDFNINLSFARAWLLLVTTLFSLVNRNYNDRNELQHYLSTVGAIMDLHGKNDLLVCAHSLRIFMLCSSRFRRLVNSIGFSTIIGPVYRTYTSSNLAIRDCIEYAVRSFYKIHEDMFVYQTVAVIAEDKYDAETVYSLLSSLSSENTESSGVPAGVKGLNDKEDMEALLQKLSGPEISISEIGKEAAERRASKLTFLTFDDKVFPRENIVRLFITVIASNPATKQASKFLRLFAAMIPCIRDYASKKLLAEGVEALGLVIHKGKTSDEATMLPFFPQFDNTKIDWMTVRMEYIHLVESFARFGGRLGATATRRILDVVQDLLCKQPESVGPAASSIIGELAKTRLTSAKPTSFLREIAPLFRTFNATIDFSGMLDSITMLVQRLNFDLDPETTSIIIQDYVGPSVKLLASASEDSLIFIVPLRLSAVKLLSVAVFLEGDALDTLERYPPSANLLASLVLPLCLMLEKPREISRQNIFSSLWIRILHYVLKRPDRSSYQNMKTSTACVPHLRLIAATALLTVQIVKLIVVRAASSISEVKGLWAYIAQRLLKAIRGGDGHFANNELDAVAPRAIDWMMWSIFELISLYPSPLYIELQASLHHALYLMGRPVQYSRSASSVSSSTRSSIIPSQQLYPGRIKRSSIRSPSFIMQSRESDRSLVTNQISKRGSASIVTNHQPDWNNVSNYDQSFNPQASSIKPISVELSIDTRHERKTSHSSISGIGSSDMSRPSFTDLSARRASRPTFNAFSKPAPSHRFPSSAGVRDIGGTSEKPGKAIIHLLGAPTQILSATSTGFPTLSPVSFGLTNTGGTYLSYSKEEQALRETNITSERLIEAAKNAVRIVMQRHGWIVNDNGGERYCADSWSIGDSLHTITDQTKILVEEEFRDIFSPPITNEWIDQGLSEKGCRRSANITRDHTRTSESIERSSSDKSQHKFLDEDEQRDVPIVSVSFE
nr:hypothetical protein L203_05132 [Cryptococcus depauperatus CBS 7841]